MNASFECRWFGVSFILGRLYDINTDMLRNSGLAVRIGKYAWSTWKRADGWRRVIS